MIKLKTVASAESKSFCFLQFTKDCIVFGWKIKLSVFHAFVESNFYPIQQKVKVVDWNEIKQQFIFNYAVVFPVGLISRTCMSRRRTLKQSRLTLGVRSNTG